MRGSSEEVFSAATRKPDAEPAAPAQDAFERFIDEWCEQLHAASRRSPSEK